MINRFIQYIVGLLFLSFGVSLTIVANVGAGAWDALNVGLSKSIGLTIGNWVIIVGILMMVVNALLVKRIEWLALAPVFIIGFLIDLWMLNVLSKVAFESTVGKYLLFIGGIFTIAVGVVIYLRAKFPANPIDNLMLSLQERFGISLMVGKTIGEVSALVLAFLLDGAIGVGTIIITFLMGPAIQLVTPVINALFNKTVEEKVTPV
ncbi:YczE/YyaS/YitT family protein [Priestia koreensis]|uniref:YczE/YyaS/YitT family protein n=1 Tax=Priestia koreensis TaxID=284581 RepID=UPI00203DDD86|nr:membrane protein [Priestia koreensis]MCM3007019.1 membrane protein [Priestia koreensis]